MHRVRIGLTGLAAVFVLTLVGAASLSIDVPPPSANLIKDPPEEPLAELGVAPGSSESVEAQTSAAAKSGHSAAPAR